MHSDNVIHVHRYSCDILKEFPQMKLNAVWVLSGKDLKQFIVTQEVKPGEVIALPFQEHLETPLYLL